MAIDSDSTIYDPETWSCDTYAPRCATRLPRTWRTSRCWERPRPPWPAPISTTSTTTKPRRSSMNRVLTPLTCSRVAAAGSSPGRNPWVAEARVPSPSPGRDDRPALTLTLSQRERGPWNWAAWRRPRRHAPRRAFPLGFGSPAVHPSSFILHPFPARHDADRALGRGLDPPVDRHGGDPIRAPGLDAQRIREAARTVDVSWAKPATGPKSPAGPTGSRSSGPRCPWRRCASTRSKSRPLTAATRRAPPSRSPTQRFTRIQAPRRRCYLACRDFAC